MKVFTQSSVLFFKKSTASGWLIIFIYWGDENLRHESLRDTAIWIKRATHKVISSPKLLPWVHILIYNVKAFISGTYHGVRDKHLRRYLAEYCYRFNRRFWESQLFGRLANAVINASPVTYAELSQ